MKTFKINLAPGITLDAAKLVEGRCLIQGASGSGKSYLVRVIAEQTIVNGLQTIILDPEGEFVTLREKCKVLIAGKGGDVPAETKSAKLLARRIAETGVSAVVDLSDLKLDDRRGFVRIFLDTLDGLPKSLEAARLVVVDESHRFCPEAGKGSAVSTEAVIALMSQGRKRGLAGVLVTQRLSKLKKDAAAEAGNIFIGRTSPIDLASAQDVLGVTKPERETLRRLKPGRFMASGPALSTPEPTTLKVRKATTSHPKPGSRHMAKTPPPQRAIAKILKEFEKLPPSEEQEAAENLADAKKRIRELERELKKAEKPTGAVNGEAYATLHRDYETLKTSTEKRENAFRRAMEKREKKLQYCLARLAGVLRSRGEDFVSEGQALDMLLQELPLPETVTAKAPARSNGEVKPRTIVGLRAPPASEVARHEARVARITNEDLPFSWSSAPGKILTVLVQWHPEALPGRRVAALAGVNYKSSTFRNALTKLRNAGVVQSEGNAMWATEEAHQAYSDVVEPLPSGDALIDGWRAKLGGVPLAIFNMLIECDGGGDREAICDMAGVDHSKSTARNAFTKLRNLGLLESGSGDLRLTEHVVEAMS